MYSYVNRKGVLIPAQTFGLYIWHVELTFTIQVKQKIDKK